jgi:Arc/MetJ family transcription regulator
MPKNYDFSRAKRGAVLPPSPGKTRITIRLDDDVLDWFREQAHLAGGANYQTQINDALRSFVQERRKPIETVLRRVVREELRRAYGKRFTQRRPTRRCEDS